METQKLDTKEAYFLLIAAAHVGLVDVFSFVASGIQDPALWCLYHPLESQVLCFSLTDKENGSYFYELGLKVAYVNINDTEG